MSVKTIFEAIVKSDRRGRGAAGETFAADMLKTAGYKVKRQKHASRQGDLRAIDTQTGEFWNIEVKTAHRRDDGRFCFHLVCEGKASTDYRFSDYVILLAVNANGTVITFLIPVPVLTRRNAKTITLPKNLNNCKWSYFRVKSNQVRLNRENQTDC